MVLRLTRHKAGHFRDVPQANLLALYGKTKPNTTKTRIRQSKEMYTTTQNKHKKLQPGSVTSYDIQPGNREGLFFLCASLIYHLLSHLPTILTAAPAPT